MIFLVWCGIYKLPINVKQSKNEGYQECLDPEKCRTFKGNALAELKVWVTYYKMIFNGIVTKHIPIKLSSKILKFCHYL